MKNEMLAASQSSVAQALAKDYFCIYYVNVDNDKFIEYSASEEYRTLGLPKAGDDILTFARDNFDKIVYPEDRERFLESFTKENVVSTLDSHGAFTMTFRLMFGKDPTYVHLKATRMIEKEGHHVVIGISSVDEQMKALEAFEKAHHASITYSRIAQALAEDYFCIYYVDMLNDDFIEYSSDEAYKKLGIEKSGTDFFNLSRKNVRRVMYEDDLGAFLAVFTKENIQKVLDEHRTFTVSYRLVMDGIPTYVSLKATRMKDEDGNHIIIGINNIDAQMRQQAQFRQSEEDRITYSRVAQALARDFFSIYVVDIDTDRFIEYSSTSEYEQLEVEKAGDDFFNLSRRNMARIICPDDHDRFMELFTKERIMAITERDGHLTTKYRLMFGDTPVWVSMKAILLDDKDGRHLIIGTNSIDAQIKREEEFRARMEDARTTAKNDFLANMSHDIRTPMNAIIGYTNIAKASLEEQDCGTVQNLLDKISSSSHFLLSLINDILDISKIESGKMQLNAAPCELTDIFHRIEDITQLQARKKAINVTYDHESIKHYHVNADELRLEQILINIISNAIKYTPEDGKVDLIAQEYSGSENGRNKYRFIIRDTGIGISEEYLPQLFESFTREQNTKLNRVQGTGLGLAITARLVELMEGHISVKSKVGEGSEFTVEIELEETEHKSRPTSAEAVAVDLAGRRALVVEDNDINAEIALMVLKQYGMKGDRAENGKQALDILESKGTGYYDAVLMDIQMPVMNGYEAASAIRTLGGDYYTELPVIAMSANAYDEDIKACLEAGMNAHIAKPFNPDELVIMLQKYITKADN